MNESAIIAVLIIVLLLLVFGPILTIWSLNTLFGLAIPYTFKTWFAALFLAGVVSGSAKASTSVSSK
jgi:hypothetical protein